MRPGRLPYAGSCELLQTSKFPSSGQSSTIGWFQDAPYRKTREQGPKHGCRETPTHLPIAWSRQGTLNLRALG